MAGMQASREGKLKILEVHCADQNIQLSGKLYSKVAT